MIRRRVTRWWRERGQAEIGNRVMATGIVISPKGGTGKTTFAINLCKALSTLIRRERSQKKGGVLYVDFDLLDPNGAIRLREPMANNFHTLFKSYQRADATQDLVSLCYFIENCGFSILGSTVVPAADREELCVLYQQKAYRRRLFVDLDRVIREYDHCVIDTPGGALHSFVPLILGSDFVYATFDLRDEPSVQSGERCLIDFFYYTNKYHHIKNTDSKMIQVLFTIYAHSQLKPYRRRIYQWLDEWLSLQLDDQYSYHIDAWIRESFDHWLSTRRSDLELLPGRFSARELFKRHYLQERVRFLEGLPRSFGIERSNTRGKIYFGGRWGNLFKEGAKNVARIARLFLMEGARFDQMRARGEAGAIADYLLDY